MDCIEANAMTRLEGFAYRGTAVKNFGGFS